MRNNRTTHYLICLFFLFGLSACGGAIPDGIASPISTDQGSPTSFITPTLEATALPAMTPEPSATLTLTASPEPTVTLTPTLEPTFTATPTIEPTYVVLRGEVNVEHANCRYGPGEPYLYKYGLVGGSNLEIIRRLPTGSWIEVQAIGGNNPCWVKAELMDIRGDVLTVQPIAPEDVHLPFSPYYLTTLRGVSARRNGSEVTISWSPFQLRPGDDSEQYPYLVEAWVCQAGELVFTPIGTYDTATTVTDEPGCAQPSHARAYAVEKHGYTKWVEVPWPAQ